MNYPPTQPFPNQNFLVDTNIQKDAIFQQVLSIMKSRYREAFTLIDHPIGSKFFLFRDFGTIAGRREKVVLVIMDQGNDAVGENFLPLINEFNITNTLSIFGSFFMECENLQIKDQLREWLAEFYRPLLAMSGDCLELAPQYPFHFIWHGLNENIFSKNNNYQFHIDSVRLFKIQSIDTIPKVVEVTDSKKIATFIDSITGSPIKNESDGNLNTSKPFYLFENEGDSSDPLEIDTFDESVDEVKLDSTNPKKISQDSES
jgi:hypothetical protein